MKKKLHVLLLLLLPLLLVSAVKVDFPDILRQYLDHFNEKVAYEKTYVQTDKTYYKPSEEIFYKGFLLDATNNKPSLTSDIIYVELRDPWGNVNQKHEQKTQNGMYDGAFAINAEAPGGLYKLVAYTNWMKNWGEEAFFTKEITVQKVITPRLLLKLDFEKRAYGSGDEVVANLKVTDLDNVNTTGSIVKSTVRIGGVAIQIVQNETLKGEAAIKFRLPENLSTSDGILQIVVSDKGIEESITRSIPIVLEKITVSFFPEGGDITEGVTGKVAFEALNEFGKGADISGEIVDDSGNVITRFESFHLGMGAFELKPKSGKNYYAKIRKPVGNEALIALPKTKAPGYTLNLKEKNEDILRWNIHAPAAANIHLIGQTQGEIYCSKSLKLKKGLNTIDVKTDDFPIGIAVFTLFDDQHKEACERLVFINPDKGLNISIETNKDTYTPSERVNLTIKTTDNKGNPVAASLGISVVDEQLLTLADDKQDNILSYLLFSSELKGKIQEPYFYFDEKEPKAKEAIDYLMLTHGWRRFTWNDVLNQSSFIQKEFPEKAGSIYGYIQDKGGKETQADVYLIETGGKRRMAKVRTTPEGHFVFHNVDVSGDVILTTELPNQVYILKGKPVIAEKSNTIAVDDDSNTQVNNIVKQEETAEAEQGGTIDMNDIIVKEEKATALVNKQKLGLDFYSESKESAMMLDEVVVVGYGVQRKSSLTGSVTVVRDNRSEMATNSSSLSTILSGRIPGLTIKARDINSGESQNVRIRGISTVSAGGEPLVVIDGIPFSGTYSSAISSLNPTEIESLSVLKNAATTGTYGSRAANGVILIQTKSTSFGERYKWKSGNYRGVTIAGRQFYKSPQYSQHEKNKGKDNSTVYWNANVLTDKEGSASLSFTNNIQSSAFRITAEGMSSTTGLIGARTKRIVTQKPFSLDAKTPLFAGIGDIIKIPVLVRNTTPDPMQAQIRINLPSNLYMENGDIRDTEKQEVTIPAGESKTIYFSLKAGNLEGKADFSILASGGIFVDQIKRTIYIRAIYFPLQFSFSGKDVGQNKEFILPEYQEGSLKAEAVSYINLLDELFDGVESIFREPYGCFEQVSSSTFPNIFALQLLKEGGEMTLMPLKRQ